ncbi:hypothetical protein GCM10011273_03330 [Asticcacaulis endophyticus]|uniref:Uncharacterized protein n=2 Tax=Asticcacaulis endophyticus TaxID=1395890 RepID=A0A918PV39_9CAUL|nr:hypothetical protein GCM10011273_03330 [Asticcacaulis endophyticus]
MGDIIDNTRFEKVRAAAASGMPGCKTAQKRVKNATTAGLKAAVDARYKAPALDPLGQFPSVHQLDTYRPCDICTRVEDVEPRYACRECRDEADALAAKCVRDGLNPVNDDYPKGSAGYFMGEGQWRRIHPKRRLGLAGVVSLVLIVLAVVLFGEAGNVVR